jgi:hypothetical protein
MSETGTPSKQNRHKAWRIGVLALLAFLVVNVLFLFWHMGTHPGTRYRLVSDATGAELIHNPSNFSEGTKFIAGKGDPGQHYQWRMVEPEPLSLWKPWQWLALVVAPPPDPETVRQTAVGAPR